jgi:pyrophosphatase PpaX
MTARTVSAVLFDLDGTLVDSIQLILEATAHAFASHAGPAPSKADILAGIGRPLAAQFAPYAADSLELEVLIARYRQYQLEHHDRLTRAYTGVPEALDELRRRNYSLAVVTSKSVPLARRALVHTGLDSYFPVLVGLEDTQRHKPHPDPVVLAMQRLGVDAPTTALVGDSPFDMEAGRAAGVLTLGATWGPFDAATLLRAGARQLVEHPSQLPGALGRSA